MCFDKPLPILSLSHSRELYLMVSYTIVDMMDDLLGVPWIESVVVGEVMMG